MSLLLDTNIAIHIRDLDRQIISRIARRSMDASIPVITLIELNSGISNESSRSIARRIGVDRLL